MKHIQVIFISTVLLFSPHIAQSRECRSELGAHLKPVIAESPFSWAVEATVVTGQTSSAVLDRTFNNQMLFTGLDYSSGSHLFYLETGLKYWSRSDQEQRMGTGNGSTRWKNYPVPQKRHFGFREFYYGFNRSDIQFRAGIQSMTFKNSLLLDERALGIIFQYSLRSFDLDIKTGTVSTDFARMGDFCSTRHIQRPVKGGRFNLVSDNLWETNFIGGQLTWNPEKQSTMQDSDDDGFSLDGFSDLTEKKPSVIREMSLTLLEEFGSGFHANKTYISGLALFNLPADLGLKSEMIYQSIIDENVMFYYLQFLKTWTTGSGASTQIDASYYDRTSQHDPVRFYPAFSNLFFGEIMRLDACDLPGWSLSAGHTFPVRFKPGIKVFYLRQMESDHTFELDAKLSMHFSRGITCYGIYSRVKSDQLAEITHTIKGEVRWAF